MIRKEITISGISQKNTADLIHIACLFESDVTLENSQYKINAKSIMGVMAFNFTDGMSISIITRGNDEQEALSAIENFFKR